MCGKMRLWAKIFAEKHEKKWRKGGKSVKAANSTSNLHNEEISNHNSVFLYVSMNN